MFKGTMEETIKHYHIYLYGETNVAINNHESYSKSELEELSNWIRSNKSTILVTLKEQRAAIKKAQAARRYAKQRRNDWGCEFDCFNLKGKRG